MKRRYVDYLMVFVLRFEEILLQCKDEGRSEKDLDHFYQAGKLLCNDKTKPHFVLI